MPSLRINPYTGRPIEIEDNRQHLQRNFGNVKKLTTWSYGSLRTYLEKFFIYRRDFRRISDFLPQKSVKDCVDLFYMCKKACKLSEIERELHQLVANKMQYINQ